MFTNISVIISPSVCVCVCKGGEDIRHNLERKGLTQQNTQWPIGKDAFVQELIDSTFFRATV